MCFGKQHPSESHHHPGSQAHTHLPFLPDYPAGDNDVTVLLKPQSGSRRWQHISEHLDAVPATRVPPMQGSGAAGAAAERQQPASSSGRSSPVERNYTVILGSHRNKCLKFEKDGELCCMVCGGPNVCWVMSFGCTWRLSRGAMEVGTWLDLLDGPVSGRVESHTRTLPPYSTTHTLSPTFQTLLPALPRLRTCPAPPSLPQRSHATG